MDCSEALKPLMGHRLLSEERQQTDDRRQEREDRRQQMAGIRQQSSDNRHQIADGRRHRLGSCQWVQVAARSDEGDGTCS